MGRGKSPWKVVTESIVARMNRTNPQAVFPNGNKSNGQVEGGYTMKMSARSHQPQMLNTQHTSSHPSAHHRPSHSPSRCSFCDGGCCSELHRASACSLSLPLRTHRQRPRCGAHYTLCSPSRQCRERHVRPALVSRSSSNLGGLVEVGDPICIRRG